MVTWHIIIPIFTPRSECAAGMRGQYYFQYGMIGAYYLSGRHFTYYDVNLKRNIYIVYDDWYYFITRFFF